MDETLVEVPVETVEAPVEPVVETVEAPVEAVEVAAEPLAPSVPQGTVVEEDGFGTYHV